MFCTNNCVAAPMSRDPWFHPQPWSQHYSSIVIEEISVGLTLFKKSKGNFLYSAASSPQDRSKRFTLYFPDRPVHWDTISASLGSIQLMLQLMREGCSYTYPPLSIARYSFIQQSELEQSRVKKLAQGFNTAARIRIRILIVKSPKLYPWAIALYNCMDITDH